MNITPESIKSLYIEMKFNGQLLSTGTGFLVLDSFNSIYLITNRHNVTGCHQDTGKPLSNTGGIPNSIIINHNRVVLNANSTNHMDRFEHVITVPKEERLYSDNEMETPLWIEHPILKQKADFVALRLTEIEGINIFPYEIFKHTLSKIHPLPGMVEKDMKADIFVGPSNSVSVIGFPFGLAVNKNLAIWSTGSIASDIDADYDYLPIFLIDCRTRPGQSGSPVIAYRSAHSMVSMDDSSMVSFTVPIFKLLGIYSGRINKDSDLGKVWKVNAIKQLILSIENNY